MKIHLAICAALLLAGCATTPIAPSSATVASSERLLAFQSRPSGPSGTLVLTRDKGMTGSGCYYGFSIDGTLAARLADKETATFYLAPGEYVLRSGRDPQGKGLCGLMQGEWTQRETVIRDGETKHFRLSIDVNGKTDIQRAD